MPPTQEGSVTTIEADNGVPFVVLTDSKGKEARYRLSCITEGKVRTYSLAKDDVTIYRVVHRPGSWHCSCPAFTKSSRFRLEGCKHIQAAREAEAFLAALTPA